VQLISLPALLAHHDSLCAEEALARIFAACRSGVLGPAGSSSTGAGGADAGGSQSGASAGIAAADGNTAAAWDTPARGGAVSVIVLPDILDWWRHASPTLRGTLMACLAELRPQLQALAASSAGVDDDSSAAAGEDGAISTEPNQRVLIGPPGRTCVR